MMPSQRLWRRGEGVGPRTFFGSDKVGAAFGEAQRHPVVLVLDLDRIDAR